MPRSPHAALGSRPRLLGLLSLSLLLGALLDGCTDAETAEPVELTLAQTVGRGIPPIQYDPEEANRWWEHVATQYPKHDSNTPTNARLREFLVSELAGLGLDVEVRVYPTGAQGQQAVLTGNRQVDDAIGLHAIVATRPGTTLPGHRIGLVSHYDTQTLTIHGAYDDASGVAADFHICKALAQVELNRTLACIFFDGEERGLLASQQYVEDVILEGDEPYVYDFVLGYDMTGINWPGHDWKLYAMAGTVWDRPGDTDPELSPMYPFTQELLHDVLRLPYDGVEVLEDSHRNSDERRFKEAGVPIIRFAGGRNATDYDQYHMPLDTVDHVYEVTNGRANFMAGFDAIVTVSYATAVALDRTTFDRISQEHGFED